MKTKAVRLYGKEDLRLEEFDLPEMHDDAVLVKVISDSVCMSTYKTAIQGKDHMRVPNDCDVNPIIVGHEFSGVVVEVGKNFEEEYPVGTQVSCYPTGIKQDIGYAFPYAGGDTQYAFFEGEDVKQHLYPGVYQSFYEASIVEPLYCDIGGFNGMIHETKNSHEIRTGVTPGGNLALIGACGPMGIAALDYAIAMENGPKRVVVTDINQEKMNRVEEMIPVSYAKEKGVELHYVNTKDLEDPKQVLMDLTEGKGYDDVMVYVPNQQVAELSNRIMGENACMNLFAGPVDHNFSAMINLYDCHYHRHKIMGTSGGTTDDYLLALKCAQERTVNLAHMITHIGGLDAVADTVLNLPKLEGWKKLIYTHIDMPLTAISDFRSLGKENPLFAKLADICEANNGLWSPEAEKALLEYYQVL